MTRAADLGNRIVAERLVRIARTCALAGDGTPLKRAIHEATTGMSKAERHSLLAQMALTAAAVILEKVPQDEQDAYLRTISGRS
ncbi:hypothetical protein [Phycicoccus duodecadis]|uniref:Uncharacterized protein n=1 Tax=Phycicoccus duodecadis TaxID=173053 RepID=A0A2N3YEY7_9MICO|nr:hypothetical protein [Phycicoccus duodecadis]PKW25403.1 hypothetical protein ATL31_0191 [Phycicoccus duodecadis]